MFTASDVFESFGYKLIQGNKSAVSNFPNTQEEADRLYKALSASGKGEMPIASEPWGVYYGGFTDKFGTRRMVDYI